MYRRLSHQPMVAVGGGTSGRNFGYWGFILDRHSISFFESSICFMYVHSLCVCVHKCIECLLFFSTYVELSGQCSRFSPSVLYYRGRVSPLFLVMTCIVQAKLLTGFQKFCLGCPSGQGVLESGITDPCQWVDKMSSEEDSKAYGD